MSELLSSNQRMPYLLSTYRSDDRVIIQCENIEKAEEALSRVMEWLHSQDETSCVGWQPIETAPRDSEAIFWIVSKDPEECYLDTSGRPIAHWATPRMALTHYGQWSSLSKATAWMPKPTPPKTTLNQENKDGA
jgi:hypothetical protein